jgi:hypothetical protein
MLTERRLLAAGTAMPFVYALALAAAALTHPGLDLGSHLPSELGRRGLPLAFILNSGLVLTGLCGLAGAAGLWLAPRRLGAGQVTLRLAALSLLAPALAFVVNGLIPLPNPLHYAGGIILGWALLPPLGALALWRLRASMALMLTAVAAAELVMIGLILGTPVVTRLNQGWWLLGLAAILFDATAALCLAVRTHLRAAAGKIA